MYKNFLEQLSSSIKSISVVENPYPFFFINDIFGKSLYDEITINFPNNFINIDKNMLDKNNFRINFDVNSISSLNLFYNDWIKIFNFMTSEMFFKLITNKFIKQIENHYPSLELDTLKIGRDKYDTFNEKDILLSCHFGINTPVKTKSTVRGAHFDDVHVLYQGLVYLKNKNDKSKGGNFCIYEKKNHSVFIEKGRLVSNNQINLFQEIPYVGNNMVCFLNTKSSIHGVSEKDLSQFNRNFVTFNAVCSKKLFDLKSKKINIFKRIINKIL